MASKERAGAAFPFSAIGVWGEIARYEKVRMNSYYIFMTRARFPPCQAQGCGGCKPLRLPEGQFLEWCALEYTECLGVPLGALFYVFHDCDTIQKSNEKGGLESPLLAAKLEKIPTSPTLVIS